MSDLEKDDIIKRKMQLLHDFFIITDYRSKMARATKKALAAQKTEIQIDNWLHGILSGDQNLKQKLKMEGYL